LKWDAPTIQTHEELKLLTVGDVFKMRMVQTVYKSLHNMLPDIFSNHFHKRSALYDHNTTNSHKLFITRAGTNTGKQTLKIKGAECYNELPAVITESHSYKSFSKRVTRYYLLNYS